MNDRINTLAGKVCDTLHDGDWNIPNEFIEKFAELIVEECANMCYKASQESFRLSEVKAGAMGMALKVLMEDHFGVEE